MHIVCILTMRLNALSDCSLRVKMYVAGAPESHATIAEIARAYDISEHHVVKVVHFLGRQGLLVNRRGRNGGLRLARAASAINVADVVRRAEGRDRVAECIDRATITCVLCGGCHLQRILKQALERFYGELARYSVADLRVQPRSEEHTSELQ